MLSCADRCQRSFVVKSARSKRKPVPQSKAPAGASPEVVLTSEERARLLAELEAELEAAERSIEEEGTISAEEFLKQRADYWAGSTESSGEGEGKAARRQRR
jgi:hypothetical protein